MPDFIRDYRPGRATSDRGRVVHDRPSFDVTAVWSDEADEVFGTRGRTERVEWARYLDGRGLLLRADPKRLLSQVRLGGGRHRLAYLLYCLPEEVPRFRERRERRVYTW